MIVGTSPIENDLISGSFKLPTAYEVSFKNLGYAENLGASGANSVGSYTGDIFNLSDATISKFADTVSNTSSDVEGYISYYIGSNETPVHVSIAHSDDVETISARLRLSIKSELESLGVYDDASPIENDLISGSFKLPTAYEVSFKNLGYAENLGASGANSVGSYTGDIFNLSDATISKFADTVSNTSSDVEGYISYYIGSNETPVHVSIAHSYDVETISAALRLSIKSELESLGVYDGTNNPIDWLHYVGNSNHVPSSFALPATYGVSFKSLDGNAVDSVSSPADNARAAITSIDAAIQTVNIQRSKLGAVSNRLSHTVNNLTNISANLSAARGGIEDADFAFETTHLAKNQILQQASIAMLAQANASKQNVLSLLQG